MKSPKQMVQSRMQAKMANIHANKGMQSSIPAGIKSTKRVATKKANIKMKASGVSQKMAGIKKGVAMKQQPKVKSTKPTLKSSGIPRAKSVTVAPSSYRSK